MPTSDLSADRLVANLSSPYNRGRYKPDGVTESNLYKLARAASVALHQDTGQCITDLEPQMFPLTAEQGFLDIQADFWEVPREAAESDGSLRFRIGQQKLIKWGAFNVDDMLLLLAHLLQTDVSNIGWSEGKDENGNFEPAVIKFNINPQAFFDLGITDVPGALVTLHTQLEQVATSGGRVILTTQGTAKWDDATTVWDSTFTWSA